MDSSQSTRSPLRRPGFWVAGAVIGAVVLGNATAFPAGRYECSWSGARPSDELAGDLVVTVGTWPGTYPLNARIHTLAGPVTIDYWTHVHSAWARELHATIPIGSHDYQALCELM